jgi:hypothetical protein
MACRRGVVLTVGLVLFAAACYSGDGLTGPDGEGNPPDDPPPAPNPSFAQDVSPIFTAGGCTGTSCHGSGADGLTLTSSVATNYANLVNVPSSSAPAFLRVEPNDPTNSYLVMKLEGRQLSGGRMPQGRPPLTSSQIGTIKNWISAGAPNN